MIKMQSLSLTPAHAFCFVIAHSGAPLPFAQEEEEEFIKEEITHSSALIF